MAQSEERTTTDQENASTFILTNVLPQAAENNQGPWSKFENFLNDLVRQQGKEVYVIAGGIYGASPATLKGHVAIPDYTWKVAVILDGGGGLAQVTSFDKVQAIAVKMPNLVTPGVPASAVGIRNAPWEDFKTTVDAIEAETGYDLLNLLPDAIELPLEANDHAPVAALPGASSGFEGTPIQFTGGFSHDEDAGDALSYAWEFGDGTTDLGTNPTHAFLDNGIYTVKLTVTDRYGLTSSATSTVTVANLAPMVQLRSTTGLTAVSGIPFSVTGTFTDAGVVDAPWAYTFSWGGTATDGRTSVMSPITASHTFTRIGTYTLQLSVTDKDGATGTSTPLAVNVVRRRVDALSLPPVINLNDRGEGGMNVVVLSAGGFDPARIDPTTATIGGVALDTHGEKAQLSYSYRDANSDGVPDLVLRFERAALMEVGALTPDTRELVVLADLLDGSQIEAHAAVQTLSPGRSGLK